MAITLSRDVLEDDLAVSLARAVASANKRASELGVAVPQSIISISQQSSNAGWLWRVNYGPKDYVGRRGGDLTIDLDPRDASIRQVLWGQ